VPNRSYVPLMKEMKGDHQWKSNQESKKPGLDTAPMSAVVGRNTFHAQVDSLRMREKAHTREGDAIAATRRRLPWSLDAPTISARLGDNRSVR